MYIDQEANVTTMIALLKRVLPSNKSIDPYLINNVRLRVLKTRNSTEYSNISIEPYHFDISFVSEYRHNADNYSKDK